MTTEQTNAGNPTMSAYTGWIKVWRQVFDHPVVGLKSGKTAQWLDLVSMANFEGPTIGQTSVSRRYLATRWRWSEKAVRCFIERLKLEGMIECKTGAQVGAGFGATLTICNYSEYQSVGPSLGPRLGPKAKKEDVKTRIPTSKEVGVPDPISAAFQAWNDLATRIGLPVATKLTDKRRRAIQARLIEHDSSGWYRALNAVEQSAFLRGQGGGRDGWTATIDFLCQASSFQKLLEGNYGNGAAGPDHNSLDHYHEILGGDRG